MYKDAMIRAESINSEKFKKHTSATKCATSFFSEFLLNELIAFQKLSLQYRSEKVDLDLFVMVTYSN